MTRLPHLVHSNPLLGPQYYQQAERVHSIGASLNRLSLRGLLSSGGEGALDWNRGLLISFHDDFGSSSSGVALYLASPFQPVQPKFADGFGWLLVC